MVNKEIEEYGLHSVKCPICNKSFKVITMTHLKTHGYTCKQVFINEYPNALLVSKDYELSNRELRRQVFINLNKSEEQRRKASKHAKELNKDSNRQREKCYKMRSNPKNIEKQKEVSRELMINRYKDINYKPPITFGQHISYVTEEGDNLTLRSFLECRVCKFLEINDFKFKYESLTIPYSFENKSRKYFPDFYLEEYNLCIEVKPRDKQLDAMVVAKKNATESLGYNFLFVSNEDLVNYENLIEKINALGTK